MKDDKGKKKKSQETSGSTMDALGEEQEFYFSEVNNGFFPKIAVVLTDEDVPSSNNQAASQ